MRIGTDDLAGVADGGQEGPKWVTFHEDESFRSRLISLYLDQSIAPL